MALILTRAVAIWPSHGLLACFLSRVPGGDGYQYSWTRKGLCLGRGEQEEGGKSNYLESGIGLGFTLNVPSEKAVIGVLYSSGVCLYFFVKYCSKVIQVNRGYS